MAEDLIDLGEIGRGAFGTVNKMLFQKANKGMYERSILKEFLRRILQKNSAKNKFPREKNRLLL
jgi:hypothetical protein